MTPKKSRKPKARRPRILVLEGLRDAASCVRAAGGEAIVASPRNVSTVDKQVAAGFDGLLLTGGGDVDTELYGQKPHPKVYGVSQVRDYVEWMALEKARDADAAVLGICRGMQLIAVHNGGVLKQHINGHRNTTHQVRPERGTLFAQVIQNARPEFVSLHHQRVSRHGPGFRVGGRCVENGIEAIESRDGRVLGVQFHPEMDWERNVYSQLIFRWLVIEAAKRAGLPVPKLPSRERQNRRRPAKPAALPSNVTPLPRRAPRRPLASRWFCRECGMMFDEQTDRDDHEYWLCGNPEIRTTEPPPGHPDWIGPEPAA